MTHTAECGQCGARLDRRSEKTGRCPACLLVLGFDAPPEPISAPEVEDQEAPARIGAYRILDVLGEGGMGTVYLAQQEHPIRRRVALKVVKRGMDTKRILARFEAERQALAMMGHPGIARVFEAGDTGDGRPYFSMEHIEGQRITTFADRARLTTEQRLRLFVSVCDAIQHAHQKGIIHRDLKPSNILVSRGDGDLKPKIIDFGIATATEHRLTEETIVTELGKGVGTPEYMSPEQADFSPFGVDTRTDIYSLGVVLYELICGHLPFDFRDSSPDEVRQRIREEDPPTPSGRFRRDPQESSEVAGRRRVDPTTLRRQLHGDLDWIALKALEKEPERRYASVAELAADIRRHLDDEPVEARPPSTRYRLGKFVRRNRLLAASLAAILLVLSAGIVVSSIFAVREATQRRAAERARTDLESVVQFQARMLSDVNVRGLGQRLVNALRDQIVLAAKEGGSEAMLVAGFDASIRHVNPTDAARELLDREILDRAAAAIDQEYADRPAIAASLRFTIGATYRTLGIYERARPQLEQALEMRERLLGRMAPETLETIQELSRLAEDEGNWETAGELSREVFDAVGVVLDPDERAALVAHRAVCSALEREGKMDEAETCMKETLANHRRVLGIDDAATLEGLAMLCAAMQRRRRLDEAEGYCLEALEGRRRLLGPDHRITLSSLSAVGTLRNNQGDYVGAEPYIREVLKGFSRVSGDRDSHTLGARRMLGDILLNQERWVEAETEYLAALDGVRETLGEDHPYTAYNYWVVGRFYKETDDLVQAETYYRSAWERYSRAVGPEHLDTTVVRNTLADTLQEQDLLLDAEAHYREILRIMHGLRPRGGDYVARAYGRLGTNLTAQRRFDEAEEALLAGHKGLETGEDASDERRRDLLERIVLLYEAWSRPVDAELWRLRLADVGPAPEE